MSIPALVPAADRAPSLSSRVVTIHATDVTEGAPAPDSFEFSLPCALRVPSDDVILRPGGVKVRLIDGRASIRLPVYDPAVQTIDGSTDWVIRVAPSWGHPYAIRVPAGTSSISLADLPNVRPLTRREQSYAITSVGVTVTEGTQAGGSASYVNGNLDLTIQVPSFRPETVYPYIDQTADARAQHYEDAVRADLDARLAEVTTAYELYAVTTTDDPVLTLDGWLASLVGPKGDKGETGAASTVPGPPNVLTVGTVTTGAAGSQASASIAGTSPSQSLSLTIPRGDVGAKGATGSTGDTGPTGKTAYQYAQDAGYTGTEAEFAAAQLPEVIGWGDIEGKPATFPPDAHSHAWSTITGKPATYAPSAHQHAIADVTGLQAALDDATSDTGWVDVALATGYKHYTSPGPTPQVRRIGDVVYLRGRIAMDTGSFVAGTTHTVLTLPLEYRPAFNGRYLFGGGASSQWGRADVSATNGEVSLAAISGDLSWIDLGGMYWTID